METTVSRVQVVAVLLGLALALVVTAGLAPAFSLLVDAVQMTWSLALSSNS